MTSSEPVTEAKELAARAADGIEVRLLWYPATETVAIHVLDTTHGCDLHFPVGAEQALDAFHHPYAYAAFRGIPLDPPLPADDTQPITAA